MLHSILVSFVLRLIVAVLIGFWMEEDIFLGGRGGKGNWDLEYWSMYVVLERVQVTGEI